MIFKVIASLLIFLWLLKKAILWYEREKTVAMYRDIRDRLKQ